MIGPLAGACRPARRAEHAGWHGALRWCVDPALATLVATVAPWETAWGHHPGGGPEDGQGFGPGLFIAGILLLVLMVGWAVFAPERDDPERDDTLDR